jgi:hypothetical protein
MEKKQLQYEKSETVESTMGFDTYHIFRDLEKGSSLAVKKNRVLGFFEDFKVGEVYTIFLEYGGCYGIHYKNTLLFHWAGYIVQYKDGAYSQVNKVPRKKTLTSEKAQTYAFRWFAKSGTSI